MSETQPKKQFKSQSVNSLFRQQVTTKTENNDLRKTSRSPTPATTKVKLVSRRKPTGIKKRSPTPPSEGSPAPLDKAESETLSYSITSTTDTEHQTSRSTSATIDTAPETTKDILMEQLKDTLVTDVPFASSSSTISSVSHTPSEPLQVNYGQRKLDWVDQDEWSDIQSQISTQTSSPQIVPKSNGRTSQSERLATYSPEGTRSWSSPNSKISSFRRSVATPMIHSLSQSPLSKPLDGPLPNSEALLNRTPMSVFPNRTTESRANTVGPQSLVVETDQWKSPTIWNTEDRHLSTKSDSALAGSWSPFDIESLSLDDPFKIQSSHMSLSFESHQPRQPSQSIQSLTESRNGSRTSRFFPSPVVEQNPSFDQFPRQPSLVERSPAPFQSTAPPAFNLFQPPQQTQHFRQQQQPPHFQQPLTSPHHDFGFQGRKLFQENVFPSPTDSMPMDRERSDPLDPITQESSHLKLQNSSQKMDHEVYPDSSQNELTQVPISLYQPLQPNTPYQPYHRRPVSYDQQAYPEGFSSTFYKRGNNNFMFIRELQPKLVTSKHRDTVEVRVSFPSSKMDDEEDDKDAMIKMRCHIVNVDVKELEGRIAGIKVAKTGGNTGRSRGFGRGHHRGYGRR